ncbi:MAG: 16S rRNA (cytosine(1402)-N(4))-methyltransferase RsmH [Deltaproteobacteria bacterium]|nr:16S rRNA (cytosine(1402)-N(4))-methyltransferase RsmH [Deltaproteobacteria bacterium]
MVKEVLVGLNCRPGHLYVDGTVGEGGHAAAILDRTAPDGELWGLDQDLAVLQTATARLAHHTSRFRLYNFSYTQIGNILEEEGQPGLDGILLDLGLSSQQLQQSRRGFSFMGDEPLDMRFNPQEGETAAHLLNTWPVAALERIFWEYGEEPRARKLAHLVAQIRRRTPFSTTQQLVRVINQALGPGRRSRGRLHPATRVFQALRIAVNRELEQLDAFLSQAPAWLLPGGRLVIISYHSLEDRQVKQRLAAWEKAGVMRRLTRKPLTPTAAEVARNPRARSAKLRTAEKIS